TVGKDQIMTISYETDRISTFESCNAVEDGGIASSRGAEEHGESRGGLEPAVELKRSRKLQPDFGKKRVHACRGLDHQIDARRFSAYTNVRVTKENTRRRAEVRAATA